jgi:UDP-glucose 4-epimerase
MNTAIPSTPPSVALVTGATGFIGARLLRAGDRALVRVPAAMEGAWCGDLLDPASLKAACEGVERIYHCAGYAHAVGSANAELHQRVNFEGARNLVRAAGEAGVKRFVFLSSVKAMAEPGQHCVDEDWPGDPNTPYGKAKRAAEDAVCEAGVKYGMHVVNLRLAMVYGRGGRGNLGRLAQGLRAGWFPRLPDTGNRRSLVHVDDVVSAVRHVADHASANGRTFIVAGPQAYSGKELCDAILVVTGKPRLSWSAPAWVLRLGGRFGDGVGAISGRTLPLTSEIVARLLDSECYSPARIEKELGWRAQIDLRMGLEDMLGLQGGANDSCA